MAGFFVGRLERTLNRDGQKTNFRHSLEMMMCSCCTVPHGRPLITGGIQTEVKISWHGQETDNIPLSLSPGVQVKNQNLLLFVFRIGDRLMADMCNTLPGSSFSIDIIAPYIVFQ